MMGRVKAKTQKKPSEDAIAYEENVAVIADGHGDHGAEIASYACTYLLRELRQLPTEFDPARFDTIMPELFRRVHDDYLEHLVTIYGAIVMDGVPYLKGKRMDSGCSLAVSFEGTFQGRSYIATANVGDTEVLLFRKQVPNETNDKNEISYTATPLTALHKPTSQAEYFRIQKLGMMAGHCVYETKDAETVAGHLQIFEPDGTPIHYKDTYTPYRAAILAHCATYQAAADAKKAHQPYKHLIPAVLEAKSAYDIAAHTYQHSPDGRRNHCTARGDCGAYLMVDSYGITTTLRYAMTRAIGDYAAHLCGMTTEPYVHVEYVTDHPILFLATDGILDCYEYHDLARIVLTSDPDRLMINFTLDAMKIFTEYDDMAFIMKQL